MRILTTCLLLLAASPVLAGEKAFTLKGKDGFEMDAKIVSPDSGNVDKVVILIHGSGPHGMDADLTMATRDKKKNLVFKDTSDALVKVGFAVLRYNKRSYQLGLKIKADPAFAKSKTLKNFQKHSYDHFISDTKAAIAYAKAQFPSAKIYLLGQSQGTYIGLQAAHKNPDVSGVALWGFYAGGLGTLAYVQTVYRSMRSFRPLDTDKDGQWTAKELKAGPPEIQALTNAIPVADQNKDGQLSEGELKGLFYSKLMGMGIDHYFAGQEANRPSTLQILKEAPFKIAFFQGAWDNQTPVFHVYAARTMLTYAYKKPATQVHVRVFPKLGHCLDPRNSYEDLLFQPVDPAALKTLAQDLKKFF